MRAMIEPSRARIDAALALAKAADTWYGLEATEEQPGWCEESKAMFRAMQAYRATAPRLRTRAEVDAAIAGQVRLYVEARGIQSDECAVTLRRLCAERTMADAIRERIRPTQDSGPSSEEASSPRVAATGAAYSPGSWEPERNRQIVRLLKEVPLHLRVGSTWGKLEDLLGGDAESNPSESSKSSDEEEAAIQAADNEDDQCGCDESEQLKDAVNEAAKLLNSIHELAKEIVMLSRRVP